MRAETNHTPDMKTSAQLRILRRFLQCALIGILMLPLLRRAEAQVPPYLPRHSLVPPPDAQIGALLGFSCAMDGGRIALGAPEDDTGALNSGVVKIFDAASGELLHVIAHPTPSGNNRFGASVALAGNRLVVGANLDSTGASSAGRVFVYDLGSATPTAPVLMINNPAPAANDNFGSALALSGNRLVVAAHLDDEGATDAGSAYVYNLASATPAVPVVTLHNPNPAANDQFGKSVAVDGNIVVVGAWFADEGASNAGRAYVYDLGGMTPGTPLLTLDKPMPAADQYFGSSVAVSGQTVAVGAWNDRTGPQGTGSVYVYALNSGTPVTPVHTLHNPGPGSNEAFGFSLALKGTRLLVGDFVESTGASAAGSAYLYELAGGTPTLPVHTFNNPDPAVQDRFGNALAFSGDHVLITANFDDLGAINAGTAYLYDLLSGTPAQPVLTISHPGVETESQSGRAVAVSGSLVAVGAGQKDLQVVDAGQVRIYDSASQSPDVPVLAIPSPQPGHSGYFGSALALDGGTLVAGGYNMLSGAVAAGAVLVYDLGGGTPETPVLTLDNPAPASTDWFGFSVAVSGTRVVVGAILDDTLASNAGSVYVYDLAGGTPTVPVLTLNHPTAGDRFGYSVAISGTRIIVGARSNDTGATDAGSAYVYDLASGTPETPVAVLLNPTPQSQDYFGHAVALEGDLAVVAAPGDRTGALRAGSVYVYDLGGATPAEPLHVLNSPWPAVDERFGSAVALSGGRLVVGAIGHDEGATDTGIAYVYDLAGAAPATYEAVLENPAPGAGDEFGAAVAIHQSRVVVGAPMSDLGGRNNGAAHVFSPTGTDASLTGLAVNQGAVMPGFDPATKDYTLSLLPGVNSIRMTVTAADAGAAIRVNGNPLVSGVQSGSLLLNAGDTLFTIEVTSEDQLSKQTYTLTVTSPALKVLAFPGQVIPVAGSPAGSMAEVVIHRSANLQGTASCILNSTDGSATAPAHYTAVSGLQVDFADGEATRLVQIPIAANAAPDVPRTFTLTLGAPSAFTTLGQPFTATVVILPPAAFTEKVKPKLTITTPASNEMLADTLPVLVSGMATDNTGIHKVQVSLNSGAFVDAVMASPGAASTAWNLSVTPLPGKNTLKVRTVDFKGNLSSVISRSFTHLRTLTVAMSGPAGSGTVSAGFMPTSRRVAGKSHTITATPRPGFVFDGWTVNNTAGTGITTASAELPKLTFIMQPGLSLTAKFIVNPFNSQLTGIYRGLARPNLLTEENNSTAGFVQNLVVTSKGGFSGALLMDGISVKLAGFFDNNGAARFGPARSKVLEFVRKDKPVLRISLQLDMTGLSHRVTGRVDQFVQGTLTARSNITADRAAFTVLAPVPAELASRSGMAYTLIFAAEFQTPAKPFNLYPMGQGYAFVSIKSNGTVSITGKLADGTAFTATATLSKHLQFPVFVPLYKKAGSFGVEITLTNAGPATDDMQAYAFWFRPEIATSQWYPQGWPEGIIVRAYGSRYNPAPGGSVLLGLQDLPANARLYFWDGLVGNTIIQDMLITPKNKVSAVPASALPSVTITARTGFVTGKFAHPLGGTVTFQGVILQKGGWQGANGYFLSPKPAKPDFLGESGAMYMEPQ